MSGSQTNNLTNPAVPNNTEVDTLLIEKFNGKVHEVYQKGENLLSKFPSELVVGTDMISNKSMGETTLQTLTPGQKPEATNDVEFNKNAFVVDTIVLGRNNVHSLHNLQNDFRVMDKLVKSQVGSLKTVEDQMVLQQIAAGGLTGGVFNPSANTITGGISRVAGQGVAINVDLKDDLSQVDDPYQLVSAIEIAILGLIIQKVPITEMLIVVPVYEYSLLTDFGWIAKVEGGNNETSDLTAQGMVGTFKSFNIPIRGSVEFSQAKANPNGGLEHAFMSNVNNAYRYDFTSDMEAANALVYGSEALLAGRTMELMTDIYFDKDSKGNVVDSWYAQGAIYDRYDNIAIVNSNAVAENTAVSTKAKGKAKATKTYS